MSTSGDIMMHVGHIMSTSGEYHEYIGGGGGYYEYIGDMMYVGEQVGKNLSISVENLDALNIP